MQKIVIVDADAIIAIIHESDSNHLLAVSVMNSLLDQGYNLFYPITALSEATTVCQRVFGNQRLAKELLASYLENDLYLLDIDFESLKIAHEELFVNTTSKQNTIFDCIVAACAMKYNADYIFSFDSFYKKQGFVLATEILKK